jgi:hypothetical protein
MFKKTSPDGAMRAQVDETAWLTQKALCPGNGEACDA